MVKPARPLRFKIERHKIVSREQWLALRAGDITASVIGALFNVHPFTTPMQVFAEKTGVEGMEDEDSGVMRRGRRLEPVVGACFLEDHPGWRVVKANVYLRAPALRLGATPDFFLVDPSGRRGVLQAKTVTPHGFKRHWTEDTPPTWVALQCLTEMMLTRRDLGMIAAFVDTGYRCDTYYYEVPRHPAAERRLQDAVAQFWQDVGAGRTPAFDYSRDASLLPVFYPRETPGKVVDWRGDNEVPALLDERDVLKDEIAAKIARKDTIETELKFKMGDAEAALVPGYRVTLKLQHRKEHVVKASSFRMLRITQEKPETPSP